MIGSHNSDIKVAFYNDRVKEVIAADLIAEPFTYVPITAGHMELVGGNAVVFGKITEGYDVIDISIDLETEVESLDDAAGRIYLSVVKLQIDESYTFNPSGPCYEYGTITCVLAITIPTIIYEGCTYVVNATIRSTENYSAIYVANPGDTIEDVKNGLKASMYLNGFMVQEGAPYNQIYIYPRTQTFCFDPPEDGNAETVLEFYNAEAYILTIGLTYCFNNLKCGATHGYGIVYKDRSNRTCSVIKSKDLDVYIPFFTEQEGSEINEKINVTFAINHKPPDWAETYEIVYFGNLTMDFFLQMRIDNLISLAEFGMDNYYGANLQQTIYDTYAQNLRWRVSDYTWQKGDRIRLIGTINEDTGVVSKIESTYYGGVIGGDFIYDYEIAVTGTEEGETADGGDYLCFQAVDHPYPFSNKTSIINLTGDLSGVIVLTTPNSEGVARVDTITLTGTSGTALICAAGLSLVATFDSDLATTADNFDATNSAAYTARGITLSANGIDLVLTANVAGINFPGAHNIIAEVYRPKKGIGETVAYGAGMVFDIGTDANGNKYHKGDVDQVLDADGIVETPAEVINTAHDCYKYVRLNYGYGLPTIYPFWAESIFPSDWWSDQIISNKLTSNGFPFLNDISQRQTVLDERIRHGGYLITGTRTNNIAHFTYDDFMDLPKKNGDITGLREVGFTLKVIQLYKETSIYINRIQTFNPDGTSQFTLTDKFFAEQRPMEDDYGCQHPDSIMLNGRNLYYWDNSQGVFIRSSPNGQQVLDIKMKRWFKDTLRWIRTSGGGSILETRTGANNDHDEVWLTFRMGTEVRGVVFSEKKGRFISRLNQPTESYIHLGNFFAHLYHQRLWIMNIDEGQDYLSWVGEPVYAEFEVVSNIEPIKNKIFNAIAVFADHLLQSLSKYVYIPEEASGTNDLMQTNIPIFDRREGVYYGKILRDENSPGTFASVIASKMNGRVMRGRYCFFKFKTEEHDEKVRVDSIVIMSTLSERNV